MESTYKSVECKPLNTTQKKGDVSIHNSASPAMPMKSILPAVPLPSLLRAGWMAHLGNIPAGSLDKNQVKEQIQQYLTLSFRSFPYKLYLAAM